MNISAIFAALLSIAVCAQTEPTKEDTIKWLQDSLPVKGVYAGHFQTAAVTARVTEVGLTDCACKLKLMEESAQTLIKISATHAYSFSFAHLAPSRITVKTDQTFSPGQVRLIIVTNDDRPLITDESSSETNGRKRRSTDMTSMLVLYFDDPDNAARVAKAIKHLATLCQQPKKEPF